MSDIAAQNDNSRRGDGGVSRRGLVRGAAASLGGGVLYAMAGPTSAAEAVDKASSAGRDALHNAGAGMHVGPDTAMGVSTFTINPYSVTCGVGSIGNSPGAVPGTDALPAGLSTTGPFAMMMYATKIDVYDVDQKKRQIIARGTMRSITTAGSVTIEDVLHPFVSIGQDNRKTTPDLFHLHFVTPFWAPDANPMATRSTLRKTWAMFGSAILLGEVNVGH